MERRKLKFPCLFGGNEESRRSKNIQSWSPDNVSVDQSLCKFEVGKSTCKQRNEKAKKKFLAKGIPNETSAKKRSEGILLKLMGRDGLSSARSIHKQQKRLSDSSIINTEKMTDVNTVHEDLEASHVAHQDHSPQSCAKMKLVMKELMTIQKNLNVDIKTQRTDSTSFIQQPDSLLLKHLHDRKGWKEEEETCGDPFAHLEQNEVPDSNIPRKSIVLLKPNRTYAKTVDDSSKEYGDSIECFTSVAVTEISESLLVPTSVTSRESEVIGGSSKIIFDENDRLTHSSSNMSELSLITEAKNRIAEIWKTNTRQEDREMVSKGSTLGEIVGLVRVKDVFAPEGLGDSSTDGQRDEYHITTLKSRSLLPSFNDINYGTKFGHEGDADEKLMVYSEPLNRDGQKDIQENQMSQKSGETFFENGGPDIYQQSISDIEDEDNDATFAASLVDEVDGYKTDTSSETLNELNPNLDSRMVGDAKSSWVDENSSQFSQLHGPDSEYHESLKETIDISKLSLLESPPDDVLTDYDHFEKVTRLQEIRKQHLLKVKSKSTSNRLRLTRKAKQLRQRLLFAMPKSVSRGSSFVAQIQKVSGTSDIDPADTFTPPYQTIHYPRDPRLLYCLEKYYFVSRSEKNLFHDRVEQMFIRISKSMVTYPWVNPARRESQLTLNKFRIEDQVRKMIDEINKETDQNSDATHLDKDPDWSHPTNEIDSLGKLIGELVLNDLVLEFLN